MANVTSNICWFVVTKTYRDISTTFGLFVPFFVYGSVCLFGFVFIYVFLPETRGKTPEETAKAFRYVIIGSYIFLVLMAIITEGGVH